MNKTGPAPDFGPSQDQPRQHPAAPNQDFRLQWGQLALVFVGGATGTLFRALAELLLPTTEQFPMTVFLINITGAFLLALLLSLQAGRYPDSLPKKRIRLLLGVGLLGGFTTYSSLAAGTAQLLVAGDVATALGYGLGTVLIGVAATFIGIALGSRILLRHTPDSETNT